MTGLFEDLVKGASGQAIQDMNVMLGLPETTAFAYRALFRLTSNPRPLTGRRRRWLAK